MQKAMPASTSSKSPGIAPIPASISPCARPGAMDIARSVASAPFSARPAIDKQVISTSTLNTVPPITAKPRASRTTVR